MERLSGNLTSNMPQLNVSGAAVQKSFGLFSPFLRWQGGKVVLESCNNPALTHPREAPRRFGLPRAFGFYRVLIYSKVPW